MGGISERQKSSKKQVTQLFMLKNLLMEPSNEERSTLLASRERAGELGGELLCKYNTLTEVWHRN